MGCEIKGLRDSRLDNDLPLTAGYWLLYCLSSDLCLLPAAPSSMPYALCPMLHALFFLPFRAQLLIFCAVMGKFKRLKNQTLAKVYTKMPSLVDLYAKKAELVVNTTTPFSPLKRPLAQCRIILITTGGIHARDQKPFDMSDKKGDSSYRELPSDIDVQQLTITHDYYHHADALADPNLVLPIEPLRQLLHQGMIGSIGPRFFSFMGHVTGEHLETLTDTTAPEVAAALIVDEVDAAFLTPS